MASNALLQKLGMEVPIIQAPMAGGPSTPELAAAVSNAGGLVSLGLAYSTPEQIADQIQKTRALTRRPFNANLFTARLRPWILLPCCNCSLKYTRRSGLLRLPFRRLPPIPSRNNVKLCCNREPLCSASPSASRTKASWSADAQQAC